MGSMPCVTLLSPNPLAGSVKYGPVGCRMGWQAAASLSSVQPCGAVMVALQVPRRLLENPELKRR